jgi:hypothetical protein
MDLSLGEKRKNDAPQRRIPVWVLVVAAFALGVILTLILRPSSSSSTVYVYGNDPIPLTATRIVEQATNMAQGVFFEDAGANAVQSASQVDPILLTATAIIQGATATAQAGS